MIAPTKQNRGTHSRLKNARVLGDVRLYCHRSAIPELFPDRRRVRAERRNRTEGAWPIAKEGGWRGKGHIAVRRRDGDAAQGRVRLQAGAIIDETEGDIGSPQPH
jgi:hypothetical protein